MKTLLSWFRGTSAVAKVLVGVWLLTVCGLVVWGIDLALGSDVGSAAGLWQVAVELFGFPLLLYGLLHELPQQLDKARRKPILSIWPSFPYVPITHRVGIENPPNVIQVPDWKPSPTLIIMNQGNAITRYVKLVLRFDSTEAHRNNATARIEIPEGSRLEEKESSDLVFAAGADDILYPGDELGISFTIRCIDDRPPFPHLYRFHYTAWAEGIDGPLSGDLGVQVVETGPHRPPLAHEV